MGGSWIVTIGVAAFEVHKCAFNFFCFSTFTGRKGVGKIKEWRQEIMVVLYEQIVGADSWFVVVEEIVHSFM